MSYAPCFFGRDFMKNKKFQKTKNLNPQIQKEIDKSLIKKMFIYFKENTYIPEGTKVKIDVEKLQKEKTYNKRNVKWKEFIENNKDTVFTVEYDENKKDNPKMVCLKEDTSPVKWLFFIGDLIVIKEVKEDMNE